MLLSANETHHGPACQGWQVDPRLQRTSQPCPTAVRIWRVGSTTATTLRNVETLDWWLMSVVLFGQGVTQLGVLGRDRDVPMDGQSRSILMSNLINDGGVWAPMPQRCHSVGKGREWGNHQNGTCWSCARAVARMQDSGTVCEWVSERAETFQNQSIFTEASSVQVSLRAGLLELHTTLSGSGE